MDIDRESGSSDSQTTHPCVANTKRSKSTKSAKGFTKSAVRWPFVGRFRVRPDASWCPHPRVRRIIQGSDPYAGKNALTGAFVTGVARWPQPFVGYTPHPFCMHSDSFQSHLCRLRVYFGAPGWKEPCVSTTWLGSCTP